MSALPLLAVGLVVIGALLAYAGAANQRLALTSRPRLRWAGWALLGGALLALLLSAGTPAAIFTWLAFAMLVWSVVPLVAAWLRRSGQR